MIEIAQAGHKRLIDLQDLGGATYDHHISAHTCHRNLPLFALRWRMASEACLDQRIAAAAMCLVSTMVSTLTNL